MKIMLDTNFLVGLYNSNDQYYLRAMNLSKEYMNEKHTLFLTNYIYDETLTHLLTSYPGYGYGRTQIFEKAISNFPHITYVDLDTTLQAKAKDIFFKYSKDHVWSFTDCTTYALMKDLKIKQILTFDDHFTEMGFEVLK